jgi:hypothetical protein
MIERSSDPIEVRCKECGAITRIASALMTGRPSLSAGRGGGFRLDMREPSNSENHHIAVKLSLNLLLNRCRKSASD